MRILLALLITAAAGCTATGDISEPWGEEEEAYDDPTTDSGRRPRPDAGDDASPTVDEDAAPPPNDPPPKPEAPIAEGLTITEVSIYQGVKIALIKDGARVTKQNADVIAGREGMLRVFVRPEASWSSHAITGVLTLTSATGSKKIETTATPSTASSETALTSTINFDIPPDRIEPDTKFSVALRDPGKTSGDGTAKTGDESFNARNTGPALKIVIVPVKYGADGSGRLPDISAAQIEAYRKAAYTTYPARKVEITVHAEYNWTSGIYASGQGFDSLLNAMVKLRYADKVGPEVYYYGAFSAKSSFSSYCSGGCVTGLCGLSDSASDSSVRACVGIGFTGAETAETMIHEVGHAHGRYHAPCGGVAGADSRFPYSGAKIGAWGWDLVTKKLIDPSKTVDFMSYCNPTWISDYTYKALTERMAFIAGGKSIVTGPAETLRIVQVAGDGTLKMTDDTFEAPLPLDAEETVHLEDASGLVSDTRAQFVRYDHLPGGFLIMRDPPKTTTKLYLPK
jgi:hypothetical protein